MLRIAHVSPDATSRISSMRWGYSSFTHRRSVGGPSGGCHASTVRTLGTSHDTSPRRSTHGGRTDGPSRVMICSPRRGPRAPLGRPPRRLPKSARVVASSQNPTMGPRALPRSSPDSWAQRAQEPRSGRASGGVSSAGLGLVRPGRQASTSRRSRSRSSASAQITRCSQLSTRRVWSFPPNPVRCMQQTTPG